MQDISFNRYTILAHIRSFYGQSDFGLRVIHVNDHHSHVEPDAVGIKPDDSFPASLQSFDELIVNVGGWPLLTAAIDEAEDEGKKKDMEVLKLHAGDAITGTIFFTLFEGESDAAFMNSVCFDAFALGNHEFDNGDAGLALFLDFLDGTGNERKKGKRCPKTPVLAANVVPGPTSPLIGRLAPYEIFKYKGTKVGVIGLDIRLKTQQSSRPDEGTVLLDEVAVATVQIAALKQKGVDIIILLSHVGVDFDLTKLATLPGVDVVVGGDSHTFMGYTAPVPIKEKRREYPGTCSLVTHNFGGFDPFALFYTLCLSFAIEFVFKPDGSVACVVQAYQYSVLFGVLDVVFDEDGNVKSCTGNPVVPFESTGSGVIVEEGKKKTVPLTAMQKVDLDLFLDGPFWKNTSPNQKATTDLDVFQAEADVLAEMVIATVPADICHERIPGQGFSMICPCSKSEMMGGGVCNLVAKAFLEITPTADFAIQNGGGCRTDIRMGEYTVANAFELLPFSNTLVTLEMTGQQVIDVLNEAFAYSDAASTGSYPYGSGIRWTVEYPSPGVSEMTVEVNPRLDGTWTAIDAEATYTVVANDFIAGGQDGYKSFLDAVNVIDTYTDYAQAFVKYAEMVGTLEEVPDEEYSTQSIVGGRMCP